MAVVTSVVVESGRCSPKTLQKGSCPYAPLDEALWYPFFWGENYPFYSPGSVDNTLQVYTLWYCWCVDKLLVVGVVQPWLCAEGDLSLHFLQERKWQKKKKKQQRVKTIELNVNSLDFICFTLEIYTLVKSPVQIKY